VSVCTNFEFTEGMYNKNSVTRFLSSFSSQIYLFFSRILFYKIKLFLLLLLFSHIDSSMHVFFA